MDREREKKPAKKDSLTYRQGRKRNRKERILFYCSRSENPFNNNVP